MSLYISIYFVPEPLVIFPIAYTAEIVWIYQSVTFALWRLWLYPLMNIHQFGDQTVILLMIFILDQITFFLPELQGCMVLVGFNIQIFNFLLFFGFLCVLGKLQRMDFVLYRLLAYAAFKLSSPPRR